MSSILGTSSKESLRNILNYLSQSQVTKLKKNTTKDIFIRNVKTFLNSYLIEKMLSNKVATASSSKLGYTLVITLSF